MDKVRDLAWTVDAEGERAGVRRLTPEGLYGRRKMTKLVQRNLPEASPGSVDRAMKALGLKGIRRAKGVRTTIPGKDGKRAGDLLNRDFTAAAPNRTWVMDFTYVRTWAGFAYTAFIVDVFAQKIVAWHCATSKDVELVMTPMRMATWQRQREGHPSWQDSSSATRTRAASTRRFASPSTWTSRASARPSARSATRMTVRVALAIERPDSCLRLTLNLGVLAVDLSSVSVVHDSAVLAGRA